MNTISDLQIRSGVRAVLNRYRIDHRHLAAGVTRGIVRLQGRLVHFGHQGDDPVRCEELEQLERDLRALRGVRRVLLSLEEWRRTEGQGWKREDDRVERSDASADEPVLEARRAEPEPARGAPGG